MKRKSKNWWLSVLLATVLCPGLSVMAYAQMGPPPMHRDFGERFGRWWDKPDLAQRLGLTDQQRQNMDQIFQEHRLKLIDLHANLEKQEVILQPLIESDQPDEGKILAQIDAVAQARAELEKANARMLLGIRRVLTQDQWTKLKALHAEHQHEWRDHMHDHRMMQGDRPGPEGPHPPPQAPPGPGQMQ